MNNIREVTINNKEYPERLRNIHTPPKKLFVRGALPPDDAVTIAIVGSRKCTAYGKQAAYDLAYALAARGVVIVSGMALGIDGEAHKGALDAGGVTVAVLGTGVDDKSIYPHTHTSLAKSIMEHGAVISEYETGTPALPHQFPERNRIISGLSLGVVVVEASEKSGSLITANFALEQGRDVFAVPGPIYAQTSRGANFLIQRGAKLVLSADDILTELGITTDTKGGSTVGLTEEETVVISCLSAEPLTVDDIITQSHLNAETVLIALTMLELKNTITHVGSTYAKKI
ncbi:MAG: DNA-processing protein DprA [Patescibacteria group bacterium]